MEFRIAFILEKKLLKENGLFICELTNNQLKEKYNSLEQIKNKKYGDKYIVIYKKK